MPIFRFSLGLAAKLGPHDRAELARWAATTLGGYYVCRIGRIEGGRFLNAIGASGLLCYTLTRLLCFAPSWIERDLKKRFRVRYPYGCGATVRERATGDLAGFAEFACGTAMRLTQACGRFDQPLDRPSVGKMFPNSPAFGRCVVTITPNDRC